MVLGVAWSEGYHDVDDLDVVLASAGESGCKASEVRGFYAHDVRDTVFDVEDEEGGCSHLVLSGSCT